MHDLVVRTAKYLPKSRFGRMRRENVVGVVCANSIDLIVDDVGHFVWVRLAGFKEGHTIEEPD